jgi:hypothetical protein
MALVRAALVLAILVACAPSDASAAPRQARQLSRPQLIERALRHVEKTARWARPGWRKRARTRITRGGEPRTFYVWIDSPDRPRGNPFFWVVVESTGRVRGARSDW